MNLNCNLCELSGFEINQGVKYVILPCHHVLCISCITTLVTKRYRKCPWCKHKITLTINKCIETAVERKAETTVETD